MSKQDSLLTTERGSWRAMLKARAVQNAAAKIETNEDGTVSLTLKSKKPALLFPPLSWLVRAPEFKRVSLDRIGTEVWRLCDGKHRVEEVVDRFAEAHDLTFHEARVAVTGYMKSLIQRGVLAIVLPD